MQPGPLHLFWTTGVFYFWSLKDDFDFVLIVPDNYQENSQFAKLLSIDSIRHVEYFPVRGRFLKHFYYNRKFKTLLQKYHPKYLLIHNCSYFENQYLLYWTQKICPDIVHYMFQNGRMSLMWKDDFAARRAMQIERLIKKIFLLHHYPQFAAKIVDIWNMISFIFNYKLMPLLTIKETFNPPVNVLTGEFDKESIIRLSTANNNYLLAYLDNEIYMYKFFGFSNIIKIEHPMKKTASEVFSFLYGDFIEKNIILILPSCGFTSRLIKNGWSANDVITHVAGRWCEAIQALLEKFPGFALKAKLHPSSYDDPVWNSIMNKLKNKFPLLIIIPPQEIAEWHIAQSRVIVGDVSSTLWWASLYGGKIVISLDIFGYPGGDEMRFYSEQIEYITNIDSLKTLIMQNKCCKSVNNDVTEVISDVLKLPY
ncbi:hypothetical protein [Thermodesulfovibrio sp.]|uniref:hypothetical protein n=1 Tax=Thermodesulfovibrio sp. TaxID=2067987 RepID=UPI0030A8C57D